MDERVIVVELVNGPVAQRGEFATMAEAAEVTPAGAYTTLRTWGERTRVHGFGHHLRRLEESSARLGRPGTLSPARVASGLRSALGRLAGAGEARVRLTFAPPALYAALEPFVPPSEEARRDGVACAIVSERRLDALCKDSRFAAVARAAAEALPRGVHEGLMVSGEGALLEGLSSNFFAVRDGVLRTEAGRVLPGLTRAAVLELARETLPVVLEPVTLDELPELTESFISSTSRGILPVVRIDGRPVGDGRPGPVTRALMPALERHIEGETQLLASLARTGKGEG
jgi:branched-chain amino acid aminotransferase